MNIFFMLARQISELVGCKSIFMVEDANTKKQLLHSGSFYKKMRSPVIKITQLFALIYKKIMCHEAQSLDNKVQDSEQLKVCIKLSNNK